MPAPQSLLVATLAVSVNNSVTINALSYYKANLAINQTCLGDQTRSILPQQTYTCDVLNSLVRVTLEGSEDVSASLLDEVAVCCQLVSNRLLSLSVDAYPSCGSVISVRSCGANLNGISTLSQTGELLLQAANLLSSTVTQSNLIVLSTLSCVPRNNKRRLGLIRNLQLDLTQLKCSIKRQAHVLPLRISESLRRIDSLDLQSVVRTVLQALELQRGSGSGLLLSAIERIDVTIGTINCLPGYIERLRTEDYIDLRSCQTIRLCDLLLRASNQRHCRNKCYCEHTCDSAKNVLHKLQFLSEY